jgi:hypothetical protein
MAKNPAFPFYANDYLVDTLRWSRGMKSLHVDLMAESWSNKEIKDDCGYPEGLSEEDRKLWDKIRHKWVLQEGIWSNLKLEESRAERQRFLSRQAENGSKGGRPTKLKPTQNPRVSNSITQTEPTQNPLEGEEEREEEEAIEEKGVQGEVDSEIREAVQEALRLAFAGTYVDDIKISKAYPGIDIDRQLEMFRVKVRGSPEDYIDHDVKGLRAAFHRQLRNTKPEKIFNGKNQGKAAGAGAKFSGTGYHQPL